MKGRAHCPQGAAAVIDTPSLFPEVELLPENYQHRIWNLELPWSLDVGIWNFSYECLGLSNIAFLSVPSTSTLCVSIVGSSLSA